MAHVIRDAELVEDLEKPAQRARRFDADHYGWPECPIKSGDGVAFLPQRVPGDLSGVAVQHGERLLAA